MESVPQGSRTPRDSLTSGALTPASPLLTRASCWRVTCQGEHGGCISTINIISYISKKVHNIHIFSEFISFIHFQQSYKVAIFIHFTHTNYVFYKLISNLTEVIQIGTYVV